MSLTEHQLGLLTEELTAVAGGRVQKVRCVNHDCLVLELRSPGVTRRLLLSVEESAARAHFVIERYTNSPVPTDFVMLLRKYVEGKRLDSLEKRDADRVLVLRFAGGELSLVAELSGRYANVFLLDSRDEILGSVLPNRSRRRRLDVGETYRYPDAARLPRLDVEDALDLAGELADGSRSRVVEARYLRLIADRERRAAAARLERDLRRRRAKLETRQRSVEGDLDRARDAERYRKFGELLQSAYGRVDRGARAVEVPDYYEDGNPLLEIPLDPGLDLQGNIDSYFRRYRKFSGAREIIERRLTDTRGELGRVLEALERLQSLVDASRDELDAFRDELERTRVLAPPRPTRAPRSRSDAKVAVPYREFRSRTGKTILVGKGGRDNDALTLRHARGNDLWLHAHDWAGAHVVVRLGRREEIDSESLLDAATLAMHYSKARKATKVEVLYTHAKHVGKPKSFPPGRVSVAKSKTILVRADAERLERLFEGRS